MKASQRLLAAIVSENVTRRLSMTPQSMSHAAQMAASTLSLDTVANLVDGASVVVEIGTGEANDDAAARTKPAPVRKPIPRLKSVGSRSRIRRTSSSGSTSSVVEMRRRLREEDTLRLSAPASPAVSSLNVEAFPDAAAELEGLDELDELDELANADLSGYDSAEPPDDDNGGGGGSGRPRTPPPEPELHSELEPAEVDSAPGSADTASVTQLQFQTLARQLGEVQAALSVLVAAGQHGHNNSNAGGIKQLHHHHDDDDEKADDAKEEFSSLSTAQEDNAQVL